MRMEKAITIGATGVKQTTGAASAGGTIPVNAAGAKPKYIRVAAINETYFRIGVGAQTAVNTDMLIQPADAAILAVGSCTHFAAIQGAAAGSLTVTPLEDDY